MDTGAVERALRVIPMGKKNWLFNGTEVGAQYTGIIQSLIVTCRMNGINPSVYLTDVLQRISQHPASQVEELTPVNWKEKYADNVLKSDLECQGTIDVLE
ncbi:Mobile element protein [hydrothermal vent metagenome]|uniref:Mobile element protein n=1 Tax=hydrothermal vent metagenome TaxID=652676 RepID=A0A3B0XEX7_9ZZZZ